MFENVKLIADNGKIKKKKVKYHALILFLI